MTDYNVEGRLITKDDWEKWLKSKEYERLKNEYDRNVYCSPEEKEERFRKMLEAEERRRLKEEYEAEIRKDQEVMKNDKN